MWNKLYNAAVKVQNDRTISPFIEAGGVAAAILTKKGNIYVGVCIDTASTLGMCAERNAIANMITNGESQIDKVVAVMPDGRVGNIKGADGKDGVDGVDGADGADGKDGVDGEDGKDGVDGADGRGVAKTEINANGELVITYTDNTSINLGKVRIFIYSAISIAASAGNSGIVIFEIKNAHKTIKNDDFRAKKCYFHYKNENP